MGQVINVKTAELAVSHNDDIIKTGSIGSCVVIILHDSGSGIGGLAHAMLPVRNDRATDEHYLAKYVPDAIDNLIAEIEKKGGHRNKLTAKLVGGAAMFRRITGENTIGHQNVESARKYLHTLGIPIITEDTGGGSGKTATFDLHSGSVEINTVI